MRTIRGCGVALVMLALGSAAQASDSSKNLAPDFSSLPAQSKIVVISYSAPRLGFFPRYQAQIDKMALGARLKS